MIINIPLQIDEKIIQNQLSVDYEIKVENYILEEVKKALLEQCGYYSAHRTTLYGMTQLIRDEIDKYLEEMKDEIIDAAADRLADRLARTKKAKELVEE